MDINAISNISAATAAYPSSTPAKAAEEKDVKKAADDTAVVYEKSTDTDKVSPKLTNPQKMTAEQRTAFVAQLKADQEKINNQLMSIVQQSISKQGSTFAIANTDDMWKFLADGNFEADADTIAQAKADIAEDGYWGVEQTSDRIVDFAIALSGNDTKKADMLLDAFKKGFKEATGLWGKDLPDISSKTYDAVVSKFDSWKNGTYKADNTESVTE